MGGRLHGSLELSAIARYSGSGITRLRELGARAAERAMRGGPAQDQRTVQSLHLESANELIVAGAKRQQPINWKMALVSRRQGRNSATAFLSECPCSAVVRVVCTRAWMRQALQATARPIMQNCTSTCQL